MILSKKDFFKHTKLKTENVPVPEWGGDVIVQEMTAIQREEWETLVTEEGDGSGKGIRVAIIIKTVVDEKGENIFSDLDAMDLGKKPGSIIGRIADVGLRLSGLNDKAVEKEVKNSKTVLSDNSTSDSAVN